MNIFYLHLDPEEIAKLSMDAHVVVGIKEIAQMCANPLRLASEKPHYQKWLDNLGVYKLCQPNHPCSKWVREGVFNWAFARSLAFWLNKEWRFRFNHENHHLSWRKLSSWPIPELPEVPFSEPPKCTKTCQLESVVESYRLYYRREKGHLAKWTKRETPKWYKE